MLKNNNNLFEKRELIIIHQYNMYYGCHYNIMIMLIMMNVKMMKID